MDPIRIPCASCSDETGVHIHALITPDIARQIVALSQFPAMESNTLQRLASIEERVRALEQINRDNFAQMEAMRQRMKDQNPAVAATFATLMGEAPAPVDAGPATFAPGWHGPHCNVDIPGGQYHDCEDTVHDTPPADDAAVVQALVDGMKANTGTMHGMAIGALAAIRRGEVPLPDDVPQIAALLTRVRRHAENATRLEKVNDTLRAELEAEKSRAQYWMHEALGRDSDGDERDDAVRGLVKERDEARGQLAEAVALLKKAESWIPDNLYSEKEGPEAVRREIQAFLARLDEQSP